MIIFVSDGLPTRSLLGILSELVNVRITTGGSGPTQCEYSINAQDTLMSTSDAFDSVLVHFYRSASRV